jgi:thioester reductase-like protein
MSNTVVTGATGFLGREIVLRLLENDPDTRLTLLIRGKDDADAQRRGDKLLSEMGVAKHAKRVTIARGDIEQDRLGMDEKTWDRVASTTSAIIHGAASVSFTLPIEEARNVNVGGTRRILDLARKNNARVDYVGTAYVAGEREGIAYEDELDVGQSFRNTYEQTKMEAEKLVRERSKDQPIAMYRPSIIVGDSRTGRTASFKVLYWPLKLYAQGFARFAPGRRSTPIDVVPSDYVVDSILAIRKSNDSLGRCYTLAAGLDRDSTIGELTDLASEFFRVTKPIFVNPDYVLGWFRPIVDLMPPGKIKHRLTAARVYTPYLNLKLRYDTRNAKTALRGTGIEVPPVQEYFKTLFRYCVETDWGKKAA